MLALGGELPEPLGRQGGIEREPVRKVGQRRRVAHVHCFREPSEAERRGTFAIKQVTGGLQDRPPEVSMMVGLARRS